MSNRLSAPRGRRPWRRLAQRLDQPRTRPLLAAGLAVSLLATGIAGPLAARPPSAPRVVLGGDLDPISGEAVDHAPLAHSRGWTPPPAPPVGPREPVEPAVVRLRPGLGSPALPAAAILSVRFSQPMDRASAEAAVRVAVDGRAVPAEVRWEEGDTLLLVEPRRDLPFGGRGELSVAAEARSKAGLALPKPASVAFVVEPRPVPTVAAPPVRSAPRPTPTPAPPRASQPGTKPEPKPKATTSPAPPARQAATWRWPLRGPITQRFGQSLTKYGFHQGLDIDGDTGDAVRAARAGVVKVAGRYDACSGLQVTIGHGDGLETWYRHLSDIDVRVGQRVAAGTVVGNVGNTGCSLGSHLHFAVRRKGAFVDPLRYLPPR